MRMLPPKVTKACEQCGSAFTLPPSQANPRKYCSRRCQGLSHRIPVDVAFWRRVNKTDTCWLWTGVVVNGYGALSADARKNMRASRLSWEMHHGPIPPGMLVCHKCDTPLCVNPDHLFLGSGRDNMQDCLRKGRFTQAYKPRNRVLSESDVRRIRELCAKGVSQAVLAKEYGVHRNTICQRANSDYRERETAESAAGVWYASTIAEARKTKTPLTPEARRRVGLRAAAVRWGLPLPPR